MYPHALHHCDICHTKTAGVLRYNGFYHSEAIINPEDDSVIEPGRNNLTLDMLHTAYAGLANVSPALRRLVSEVEASKAYEAQQSAAQRQHQSMPWTAAGLSQAMLDQQVLRQAFEEQWPDRRIGFSAKWPQITPAKGANGISENHVHAGFLIEGDALTVPQIQSAVAYAAKHYERLANAVLASGFSVSQLQTGPFGKAWTFEKSGAAKRR